MDHLASLECKIRGPARGCGAGVETGVSSSSYVGERHHARLPFDQRHRASELVVGHTQEFELGHGGPRGWQRAAQRIFIKVD